MEKTWTKALMDSISEVFSTMFFMVPENDADMEQSVSGDSADDWVEGWVELEGPDESVRLCVWAPVRAARELAANILSCELHELDSDDMLDAYREMLNMAAGSYLTRVDAQGLWRMGLPQARKPRAASVGDMVGRADWKVFYNVEELPLAAGLQKIA